MMLGADRRTWPELSCVCLTVEEVQMAEGRAEGGGAGLKSSSRIVHGRIRCGKRKRNLSPVCSLKFVAL